MCVNKGTGAHLEFKRNQPLVADIPKSFGTAFNQSVLGRGWVAIGLQKIIDLVACDSAHHKCCPCSDHSFLGELDLLEAGLAVATAYCFGHVKRRVFTAFWTCNFHKTSLLCV